MAGSSTPGSLTSTRRTPRPCPRGAASISARATPFERADGKPISLRANVINVGNNNYWQTGSGFSGFINQGPPRTYMLSLTADF